MQEGFGCAVENRFIQLQDDDCDPLDLLHQATLQISQRKKKEAKKAANQKGNKKESQKDRKIPAIVSSIEEPGQKRAPKPTIQKVTQNENSGTEVKVDRAERRSAFREFRTNFIEKPLEYSIEDFEKEKQVRNWVANQRGGTRGRGRGGGRGGFPRNMENEYQRGKREFERHSGSDRADEEPVQMENTENYDPTEPPEEEQDAKASEDGAEDYGKEMTLDEWKCIVDQSRPKAEFNLRKPASSVPSKAVVIHKSKFVYNMKDDEACQYGFRRPVNDITSQLDINFGNLPRPGRGGRGGGGGRGRVKKEESFPHEFQNVNDFVLNPEDPDHFPALC